MANRFTDEYLASIEAQKLEAARASRKAKPTAEKPSKEKPEKSKLVRGRLVKAFTLAVLTSFAVSFGGNMLLKNFDHKDVQKNDSGTKTVHVQNAEERHLDGDPNELKAKTPTPDKDGSDHKADKADKTGGTDKVDKTDKADKVDKADKGTKAPAKAAAVDDGHHDAGISQEVSKMIDGSEYKLHPGDVVDPVKVVQNDQKQDVKAVKIHSADGKTNVTILTIGGLTNTVVQEKLDNGQIKVTDSTRGGAGYFYQESKLLTPRAPAATPGMK